ncbi:MAG: fibronectin type III domain-containing protein [Solirubrobacteraceae bacterium]
MGTRRLTLGVLATTLGLAACSAAPALAAEAPTVLSESAPSPKAEEARLEALVNPNNQSTECHFQYGEATVTENEVACEQPTIEGGEQGVGLTIATLKQNTLYRYRVILKNTAGEEAVGVTESFTTALRPEAPVTLAATSVTGTTATLNGELNPNVTAKDGYYFTYDTNGTCEPAFVTPAGEEQTETKREVSTPVTELVGSTEYTFCVLATNEVGETTSGAPVSFKTPPEKPVVVFQGESAITPFDATLEGFVNPENQETTYHLQYATDSAFTENVKTLAFGISAPGLGSAQPVGPADLAGALTPATTYFYRVIAKNATGETTGPTQHFETLAAEKPILQGEHTGLRTAPQTTIEGELDPNYQPIFGCEVQYVLQGTGFGGALESVPCQANNPPENTFGEGAGFVPLIATLTGLHPGASYEYRILATNNTGTTEGTEPAEQRTFAVPPPPLLTVGQAQNVTRTTATLPGTVNPEGLETSYYYKYGTTTSYGGNAPSIQGVNAGSGTEAVPAPIGISGLEPATTYHYRLVASNADGPTESTDKTFTTAPRTPPTASTGEASSITLTTATVAGTINPEGLETSYELDLGTDMTYGTSLYGEAGSANTPTEITLSLQNLAPASTYHYRIVAINSDGRVPGTDRTFTTPAYNNPIVQPFTLPLLAAPAIAFPTETKNTGEPTVKKLTRAQKLAKALKACKKDKAKHKRVACERLARKRYAFVKKGKKGAVKTK